MRRLEKLPEPRVLATQGPAWTRAYVSATPGQRSKVERWRHDDIKRTLRAETDEKCAYCESFVADVAYAHVEHIVPKSIRPDLAHSWFNLTLACPRCNVSKDVAYHPSLGVLNPYADEITQHLIFLGYMVDCPLGDVRGELTMRACGLNRLDLVKSRIARISAIRDLVDRWNIATGHVRQTLELAIRIDASQGEYSAHVKAYLLGLGFPLASQNDGEICQP